VALLEALSRKLEAQLDLADSAEAHEVRGWGWGWGWDWGWGWGWLVGVEVAWLRIRGVALRLGCRLLAGLIGWLLASNV